MNTFGLRGGIRTHVIPAPKAGAITRLGDSEINLFTYLATIPFIFSM